MKISYGERWHGKVKRFNERFLPGTSVVYTTPAGVRIKTKIRYPALVLSNGTPVIWLVNIREYCRFDRIIVS